MNAFYHFTAKEIGDKCFYLDDEGILKKGTILGINYYKTEVGGRVSYRIESKADIIEYNTIHRERVFETQEEAVEFLRRQKEIEIEKALKNLNS